MSNWFEVRDSLIQGKGAFAKKRIPAGTMIIEYIGDVITHEEADRRYDDESMERHHTFLFAVDDEICIDGVDEGNEAKYINHSCDPNCEPRVEDKRVFIYALRDIEQGEELFYDYAYERDEDDDDESEKLYACRCGNAKCRGTILAPKDD
jgi:uncharacterized protein